MASGLASGFALSSYGIVSGVFEGVGDASIDAGLPSSDAAWWIEGTTRWDPLEPQGRLLDQQPGVRCGLFVATTRFGNNAASKESPC